MKEYIVTSEQLDRVNALLMAVKQTKLDFSGLPELTRCRDCERRDYDYDPISDECIASECCRTGFDVMGDHYCAWGKRGDHEH